MSVCPVLYLFLLSSEHLFNELKNMRGDADQVADVRSNRKASIFLPINPSKIISAVSGSMHRMPCFFPRSYFMLKLVPGTLNSIQ